MIEPRKSFAAVSPYKPPLKGRRRFTRLDFNENTQPGEPLMLPAEQLSTYPEYGEVESAVAEAYDLNPQNLLLTNGSSEALMLSAFAYVEPGKDAALTSSPTFSLIPHYLELSGARLIEVPAIESLDFDIEGITSALNDGVELAVFASPDNPSGAVLELAAVRSWCERYQKTLFLIDEAYAEYAGGTLLPDALRLPNLLVSRTFSKAWGLAGLRIGFVAGNEDLLQPLKTLRAPYSVNSAAVSAIIRALPRRKDIELQATMLLQRKRKLLNGVARLGYRVISNAGNFFLLRAGIEAERICHFLRREGILVRDRSGHPLTRGMVRVTVGDESECRSFLAALSGYRQKTALIFDLDDTLVDTSKSYDATIARLVGERGGIPLRDGELSSLRAGGGFNDDWVAASELLARRGVSIPMENLIAAAKSIYLKLAPGNERLLVDEDLLNLLGARFRLFILTGRPRDEYEPLWRIKLDEHFEAVYCLDDFDGLRAKPAPDMLSEIMSSHGLDNAYYVGNSVDDMSAARAAGAVAIGVETTLDGDSMRAAGADLTIGNPAEIREVFQI